MCSLTLLRNIIISELCGDILVWPGTPILLTIIVVICILILIMLITIMLAIAIIIIMKSK